jgi:hypothetical protein
MQFLGMSSSHYSVADPCYFGTDLDPCLWLMVPGPDSDPDPAIFVTDLQDANKKLNFLNQFFCLLLFEGTFTSFSKDKKSNRSHKTVGIKIFLMYYFCLMIGSGSVPLTNGSGSGSMRPKNIRIRNTDYYLPSSCF